MILAGENGGLLRNTRFPPMIRNSQEIGTAKTSDISKNVRHPLKQELAAR